MAWARMPELPANELELQRRWAESRWPTPFLHEGMDGSVRVISPGRWNRGPGPDFHGAQILDAEGRARRGDVELHIEAAAWLQHGHAGNPAYANLLLHIVEWSEGPGRRPAQGNRHIPDAIPLPQPITAAVEVLPCVGIVPRVGAAAVEARLLQIAQQRFLRKAGELQDLDIPTGPGTVEDRRAVIAAARALGQPYNARIATQVVRRALERAANWSAVELLIETKGWRYGRGALGQPEGLARVLTSLLQRWTAPDSSPWTTFQRLSSRPLPEATAELRIAGSLGPARTRQLLADAVYPLARSWTPWSQLPGVRYRRTDELRDRLDGDEDAGFNWRHPQTQALLELEQTRCRQWACRICPLAALDYA